MSEPQTIVKRRPIWTARPTIDTERNIPMCRVTLRIGPHDFTGGMQYDENVQPTCESPVGFATATARLIDAITQHAKEQKWL